MLKLCVHGRSPRIRTCAARFELMLLVVFDFFYVNVFQLPGALTVLQRCSMCQAMNVMSMIRAAGRSGDVQKALDLLRKLELGERYLA